MVKILRHAASWQIPVLTVPDSDAQSISDLIEEFADVYQSAEDQRFLSEARLLAQRLPLPVRKFLHDAREYEKAPAYVVSCPLGRVSVPTPPDWWSVRQPTPTQLQEMLLVLLGSLFGDVFAWATQQAGRFVHDVVPIAGQEYEQLGSGSITPLSWHTEDAFHPFRGDYVGLACLRNLDGVATTLLAVDDLTLDQPDLRCLRQNRFFIIPDNSHLPKNNPGMDADSGEFDRISEMFTNPSPIAPLFGPKERLYLRADPDFMHALAGDQEAAQSLKRLFGAIEEGLQDIVLEPGDFLFIDNFRCAHGRRSFEPRYDGQDRWLKRINVSRDLRPARAAGSCTGFRMVR